ncbi:MAG: purine-nucleoside phosphorylase [Candidatus Baltobacteraceae bacterium]
MRDLLAEDSARLLLHAGGKVDCAIVLGSGLSSALAGKADFDRIGYSEFSGMPIAPLTGHAGEARLGVWQGKRVLAFAGRVHLYQGFSAQQVTFSVALAAAVGARTLIVTNAAGGLNGAFVAGDLMLIADHMNLTGVNPLVGSQLENPFIDMQGAYSERLRAIAKSIDPKLREGTYAGVLGPTYETPAEARYLRTLGADAAGMSTVLETIAARARGIEVLGISLITNIVGAPNTNHAEVTAVAGASAPRLATLLDGVLTKL